MNDWIWLAVVLSVLIIVALPWILKRAEGRVWEHVMERARSSEADEW